MAQNEVIKIKREKKLSFHSLVDLKLINSAPRIYEFLPKGLEFLKPALLAIRFNKAKPGWQPVILHGFYNDRCKIVWELMTIDVKAKKTGMFANSKIKGFSFLSYFMVSDGPSSIPHFLNHYNEVFICYAYVYHGRRPDSSVDISVVILSQFVDAREKEKHLNRHLSDGYVQGAEGDPREVKIDLEHAMRLDFPGVERPPHSFNIRVLELDSVGFLVRDEDIDIGNIASGSVKIYESGAAARPLWDLKVDKQNQSEYNLDFITLS